MNNKFRFSAILIAIGVVLVATGVIALLDDLEDKPPCKVPSSVTAPAAN